MKKLTNEAVIPPSHPTSTTEPYNDGCNHTPAHVFLYFDSNFLWIFMGVKWTIIQYLLRQWIAAAQAPSHYLKQCWPRYIQLWGLQNLAEVGNHTSHYNNKYIYKHTLALEIFVLLQTGLFVYCSHDNNTRILRYWRTAWKDTSRGSWGSPWLISYHIHQSVIYAVLNDGFRNMVRYFI